MKKIKLRSQKPLYGDVGSPLYDDNYDDTKRHYHGSKGKGRGKNAKSQQSI